MDTPQVTNYCSVRGGYPLDYQRPGQLKTTASGQPCDMTTCKGECLCPWMKSGKS